MKFARFITGFFFTVMFCAVSVAQTSSLTMPSAGTVSSPTMSDFPSISSTSNSSSPIISNVSSVSNSTESDINSVSSQYMTASTLASISSSLLGNSSSLYSLVENGTSNYTTNTLLQQILTKLNDMNPSATAKKVDASSEDIKTAVQPSSTTTKGPQVTGGAKILRCTTNGYNILSTCRTIYSSAVTDDGTFLITGDRKYLSNHRTRSETFYMLFKKTAPTTYEVGVSVLQDYLNEYSFLYQLSNIEDLKANSIGNLLVLKIDEPDWKFDMLIDITDLDFPDFTPSEKTDTVSTTQEPNIKK